MKYVVELSRDEMISVLDALQTHADYLENSASLQSGDAISYDLKQLAKKQVLLYRKILDTFEMVE